jgi:hypothetical protein
LGVSVVLHIPDQAGPPCLALSIGMALGFAMAGPGRWSAMGGKLTLAPLGFSAPLNNVEATSS